MALTFVPEAADYGQRLDAFLTIKLGLSRSAVAELIAAGQVLIDGQSRKPAFKVLPGQTIEATLPQAPVPFELAPQDLPLEILYADEAIIVLDKPAGLTVHPGAGQSDGTLVNALLARYPDIVGVGDEFRPGIVHRLDRLTSGVMVVARSAAALSVLTEAFKNHEQRRVYQALCWGHMPKNQGRIETLFDRHPKDRKRMSSRVSTGRTAITNWRVLQTWPGLSLLELELETGRTHQIRVHLADQNHPVIGDPVYGGRNRAGTVKALALRQRLQAVERQMLHACLLGLKHPLTGEYLEFVSPLAADMQALIDYLNQSE